MTWLNPLAWIGVAGIALPVLIHLLGRGHARVHRFPTLRFLTASRLLPTRRTTIHDALLLAVRCGVIILAAAALARPLLLTAKRTQALDRGLARAIIVDTSASMRRSTPTGALAIDSARNAGRTLAASAQASITIESNDPSRALRGSAAWLERQGRRAELVVISDFQRGQIDSIDLSRVPGDIGVTLDRVPTINPGGLETQSSVARVRIAARSTLTGERLDAEWAPAGASLPGDAVSLLGPETDRAVLEATRDAAWTIATPLPVDTARAIAIVFPKFAGRAELLASVAPTYAPWMVDVLSRLAADSIHVAASGVAHAAGRQRLLLFANAEPGSLEAARLTAVAKRATSVAPAASELEPETMSAAALAALERPASNEAPTRVRPLGEDTPSDGRWLWAAALALLALEIPLRRRPPAAAAATRAERARAA